MNFKNKVVLITGASSGIGAAIAVKLSKYEAKIAIVGRNEDKLKNVKEICEKNGSKVLVIKADLTKDEKAKNVIHTVIQLYGKLDVLVNNAGIFEAVSILDDNAMRKFDDIVATNLRACVYLTHLAVPYLINTKGNIINISSASSTGLFFAENFSYCTSKAGLDHFSRAVALELAPKGVRVNCVNPGPVKTDFIEKFALNKNERDIFWKNLENATALGKTSTPEEIADIVLFLASDVANSMTGSSFVIDNGILLKG